MKIKSSKKRSGFTLVEIMIVVAIIALLAAIAVPNFLRARKRSQATREMEDLRMLDNAISQYAMETNKTAYSLIYFSDIQGYLKKDSALYSSGTDMFGQQYGTFWIPGYFWVDIIPSIPYSTYAALSDVADNSFWSPYTPW
jgi:prepilin-type N-terminal cleavage/methylation domain-containing protein